VVLLKYRQYYDSYTLYIRKGSSKEFNFYKEMLRKNLDKRGITMGDWFIEQMKVYLKKGG
jgi:hypothetical protein